MIPLHSQRQGMMPPGGGGMGGMGGMGGGGMFGRQSCFYRLFILKPELIVYFKA